MAEKLIFEKQLAKVTKEVTNYDRCDSTGDFPKFPEKHYLPKGSVPNGAKVVCRYYLIED